jgi:hypothetical protein
MAGDQLIFFGRPLPPEHVAGLLRQPRLGLYEIWYRRGPALGALGVCFSWGISALVLALPFLFADVSAAPLLLAALAYGILGAVASLWWWWAYRAAAQGGAPQGAALYRLVGWNNLLLVTMFLPLAVVSVPMALVTNALFGAIWACVALGALGAGVWLVPILLRRAANAAPAPVGADRPTLAAGAGAVLAAVVTAFLPSSSIAIFQLLANVLSLLLLPLLPYIAVAAWIFLREAQRLAPAR